MARNSLQREALAEVEAPDLLVGDQRFGSTGEQDLSVVDDAGAVDDVERLADIVVGDEHADVAALQLAHQLADVGDRDRVDPGERLVEQHDGRLGRERPGDLAPPPLAPGQRHRRRIAQRRDSELAEQLLQPRRGARAVGLGHLEHRDDILLDRHAAENRRLLRQIAEAEDRPAVHRQLGDVLAVEEDPAAVGLHQAHHRIEAGGLAGAVRPEQADDFAAMDVERDVVKDRAAVVGLGDRADFEPAARLLRLARGPREGGRFVHSPAYCGFCCWRCGTVKWPVTRPPLEFTPGGPPSITARPESRSMTSRDPFTWLFSRVSWTLPIRVMSLRSRS